MTRPTYTEANAAYDYAINGIPFFSAASDQMPLIRQTSDWSRQQLDTSTEPGEQSLNDWWRRSQASFHLGAGLAFYDPASEVVQYGRAKTQQYRFQDSRGVDPWTKGQVSLLKKCTSVAAITSSTPAIAGFSAGGEDGVLFSDGTAVKKYRTSDGAVSAVTWGGATTVFDLAVNGGTYFVACDAGIYAAALPAGAGTKFYTFPASVTRAKIGWVKERLIVAANESLYECPIPVASPPAAMPAALYTHPTTGWLWTGVAAGPDAIYVSGYVGDQSSIFASGLETTQAGAVPTVSVPSVVAELPRGEVALSMISYMGAYVILGTNLGVRVCVIQQGGGLVIGPLSAETDGPVYGLAVRRQYVRAGGGAPAGGGASLYRVDLEESIDVQGLKYPYARDLEGPVAGTVTGVAPVGQSGRTAFVTAAGGLIVEHATDLVSSGWLETGRIRFDTWEDKLFQFLKVNDLPGNGSLKAEWRGEDAVLATCIPTYSTAGVRQVNADATDGLAHSHVSFRFTLTPSGTTVSPTFTGYQSLAQPANVRQRSIRLALLCMGKEGPAGRRTVERSVWDRVTAMESAEKLGAVVVYQDFGTGESRLVRIDKLQFVSQETPEQRPGRKEPGGVLLVTLVAVD